MTFQLPAARRRRRNRLLLLTTVTAAALVACATKPARPSLATADHIDLQRYMGDWYVIASIPAWPERDGYDALESYRLQDDGRIATTFTYRDGAFDAPLKTITSVASVVDPRSNAVWGVQFFWPFKADYRIVHVDAAYREVIVGREKRDYVWIMSRTPTLDAAAYERLVGLVAAQGYDISQLRKVPQRSAGRG